MSRGRFEFRARTLLLTAHPVRATVAGMESKLAQYAEQQLIEAAKRMTPEQRLRAYLEHSKRMTSLQRREINATCGEIRCGCRGLVRGVAAEEIESSGYCPPHTTDSSALRLPSRANHIRQTLHSTQHLR